MATEPTLETVNEDGMETTLQDVENIPLDETADTYMHKSNDVAVGRSKKKRRGFVAGLTVILMAAGAAGVYFGLSYENRKTAEAMTSEAAYFEGEWPYYSEECKKWRARNLEGDANETPYVHTDADTAPEGASGVERRLDIVFGDKVGYLACFANCDRISIHRLDPQLYFRLRRLSTSVRGNLCIPRRCQSRRRRRCRSPRRCLSPLKARKLPCRRRTSAAC